MPLPIGTRFGPYEVTALVGAGGMGEVYRARDRVLNRDVALKILPELLAADPDRLARFKREAQVLAALNHPNIAAIYGVEDAGSEPPGSQPTGATAPGGASAAGALVLELVDGQTLADRISRGAVPLDEVLPIARQIAEALEAAHAHGIIHRDLKPANIKLRPDGAVKVLDFGLAKLAQPHDSASDGNLDASPTITSPAMMTGAGVLLGTAGYMSPEQARGHVVDKGADIWAFGCVLFEMITGARTFPGADATDTIAAIIRGEPDWSRLPPDTPPGVRRILRRCLTKDRRSRLADIRDARLDLEDAMTEPAGSGPTAGRRDRRERLIWSAALLLCGLVTAWMLWRGGNGNAGGTPVPEMRVEITTPPTTDQVSLALAPDGQKLAFVASSDGRSKLWLHSLATGEARPLQGTDGASFPFWSPDSRSIGFFANDRVNRIDIDGGSLRVLAAAPVGSGGTWSREGVIVYTTVPDAPLSRVSADGGEATVLPGSQPGEPGHRFAQFLPDGRHFLYFVAQQPSRGVYVGTLDGPERQHLLDADAAAVFVPPARLLFLRAGMLYAQRFDPARRRLEGNAVRVAEGVNVDAVGVAAVSGSAVGSIVYRPGSANRQRQLAWFDRSGKPLGTIGVPDPANSVNPSLSPDGRRLALNRSVDGNADIWLLDLERTALSRFTFDASPDIFPVWSPDGGRLAYAGSKRQGPGFNVYIKPAVGAGEGAPLLDSPDNMIPTDWSRDGRFVLYMKAGLSGGYDIGAIPADAGGKPFLVAQTRYDERSGQFSPDGQWMASESNESGRYEIYVQPFPGPGAHTLVSTGGGLQARWSADGKELFYIAPDGRLMAVAFRVTAKNQTVEPTSPVPLFVTRVGSTRTGGSGQEYVVSRDGRFLMNTLTEQAGTPIVLVLNLGPIEN